MPDRRTQLLAALQAADAPAPDTLHDAVAERAGSGRLGIGVRIPDWANPQNASVLDPWWKKALRTAGGVIGAADPVAQAMAIGAPLEVPTSHGDLVPVTRLVDHGANVASTKGPETWFAVGHLDDAAVAQLNDMYKGGTGRVVRGYMPRSALSLAQQQTDEFGNRIASSSTEAVKQSWRPVSTQIKQQTTAEP